MNPWFGKKKTRLDRWSPWLCTFAESMDIMREALLLETCGTSSADPSILFVSMDFEFDVDVAGHTTIREIGICTFDTRSLFQPGTEPTPALSTLNYRWKENPQQSAHHRFLFGETKKIIPDDVPALFHRLFQTTDGNGQLRKIILVGHAIDNELRSMEAMGIEISKFPSIVGIFDTCNMSRAAVRAGRRLLHPRRLGSILQILDIPHAFLHVAGNDAHFTLKLVLMLAVRHLTTPNMDPFSEARLATINSIAQGSIQAEMSIFVKVNNERRRENKYLEWLNNAPSLYLEDQSTESKSSSDVGSSDQADVYEGGYRGSEEYVRPRLDLSSVSPPLGAEESIQILADTLTPQRNGCSSISEQNIDNGVVLVALYMQFCAGAHQARGREAHQIYSVGICSLDTRSLNGQLAEPQTALFTENLVCNNKRGESVPSNFLFGESKTFLRDSFRQDLQHHISRYGPSRRIILIGHNIQQELCAIRNMDIDFQAEFPSVIGIISTKTLARAQIPPRAAESTDVYRIGNLFHEYGITDIPEKYIYIAGNIAHFMLRLLLMQAIRAFKGSDTDIETASTSSRIACLEAIAQAPIRAEMLRETPDYAAFWKMKAEEREAKIEQKKERKRFCQGA